MAQFGVGVCLFFSHGKVFVFRSGSKQSKHNQGKGIKGCVFSLWQSGMCLRNDFLKTEIDLKFTVHYAYSYFAALDGQTKARASRAKQAGLGNGITERRLIFECSNWLTMSHVLRLLPS